MSGRSSGEKIIRKSLRHWLSLAHLINGRPSKRLTVRHRRRIRQQGSIDLFDSTIVPWNGPPWWGGGLRRRRDATKNRADDYFIYRHAKDPRQNEKSLGQDRSLFPPLAPPAGSSGSCAWHSSFF